MDSELIQRQIQLEENALGIGLARAMRAMTGERTREDVETFGGDAMDGADRRKFSFLYTIAALELPKLIKAIEKRKSECGTKSVKLYNLLDQCGEVEEVAGVVVKTFFNLVFVAPPPDDDGIDEDDVDSSADTIDSNIATVNLAQQIAETLDHLRTQNAKKAKSSNKKTSQSPEDILKLALELAQLYIGLTDYYNEYHTDHSPNRVELNQLHTLLESSGIDTSTVIENRLQEISYASPKWTPMLVCPKRWESIQDGGYLGPLSKSLTLIKKREKIKGFSFEKCPEVFDAINTLQETGFTINTAVLNVFSYILDTFTSILQEEGHFGFNHDGSRYQKLLDLPAGSLTNSQVLRQHWFRLYGLRDEAMTFSGSPFYYVLTCDFRGRIYPTASALNYQAGDLPRSLVSFADGKPVPSSDSEKWLKRHGANCYAEKVHGVGIDKSSFLKREQWVTDNESKIIGLGERANSGDNFWNLPKDLEDWWLKADKPWAFLAWADEWYRYKRDPGNHVSHLPIEVDGSSNGYQHIAALLRSKNVAHWVNMLPCDTPNDIYAHVAKNAADGLRDIDAKNPFPELCDKYFALLDHSNGKPDNVCLNNVSKQILVKSLIGELPRSAAKKIIMTYPYSAKPFRMAKTLMKVHGIFKDWTDEDIEPGYNAMLRRGLITGSSVPKIRYLLANTLAMTICDNIRNLYPEIPELLDWFKQIGRIASIERKSIQWVSPTGLPVIQNYEKMKSVDVSCLGRKYKVKRKTGKTDMKKHSDALGPNFIHSCDAAHLVKTVNRATNEGITSLRMIHDSYATHAADMESLFRIIREEFIRLYREKEPLNSLKGSIVSSTQNAVIDPVPQVGDLDIGAVKTAEYFFA